jgi:hypothetical protein
VLGAVCNANYAASNWMLWCHWVLLCGWLDGWELLCGFLGADLWVQVYKWYARCDDLVGDCFCGGHVRGAVASLLGLHYHGVDVRAEQVPVGCGC